MSYKNWADTDVLNAADLNAMTADPDSSDVTTAETTATTSYTDLASAGPSRTVQLVSGQACMVIVSALISTSISGDEGAMSFSVSGAATVAAQDVNAARNRSGSGNQWTMSSRASFFTATSTGTATITSKYKYIVNVGGGSARFEHRRLLIKKF